jgi:uncharacterized protein
MKNPVMHFEIRVDDLERAKKFYSIFDWQLQDSSGDMPFTAVTTVPTDEKHMPKEPGGINGIMTSRKKGEPAAPTFTIGVDSIDECVKKIEASGGKMMMKKSEMPHMGYFAYFKDTEGNVIGIWENWKE